MPAAAGYAYWETRLRNREATASSCCTCPNVNERRNDPSVDGVYGRWQIPILPVSRKTLIRAVVLHCTSVPQLYRPTVMVPPARVPDTGQAGQVSG